MSIDILYWRNLALATKLKALNAQQDYVRKIIHKLNAGNGSIELEELPNNSNSSLFSFKLNQGEMVICNTIKHNDEESLLVIEILANDEYNKFNYLNNNADKNYEIVATIQESLEYQSTVEEVLPQVCYTYRDDKLVILSLEQQEILRTNHFGATLVKIPAAAGCGKTTTAISIMNNDSENLYLCRSTKLASYVQQEYAKLLAKQGKEAKIVCKTYLEFCSPYIFYNLFTNNDFAEYRDYLRQHGQPVPSQPEKYPPLQDVVEFLKIDILNMDLTNGDLLDINLLNGNLLNQYLQIEENPLRLKYQKYLTYLAKYISSHLWNMEHFQEWIIQQKIFQNYYPEHRSNSQETQRITREIYQDLCKLHNKRLINNIETNDGLTLGQKEGYGHGISKDILTLYQNYLKKYGTFDLSLFDPTGAQIPDELKSKVAIVDDISVSDIPVLMAVNSHLFDNNSTLYCLYDINQGREDYNSISPSCDQLAITTNRQIKEYPLTYNYRLPENVNEVYNIVLQCKRKAIGGPLYKVMPDKKRTGDEDGLNNLSNTQKLGYLARININSDGEAADSATANTLKQLKREAQNSIKLAIVIPHDSMRKEAEEIFSRAKEQIYTPQEVQGLEFTKVILYKFFVGKYSHNYITYPFLTSLLKADDTRDTTHFAKNLEKVRDNGKYSLFFDNLGLGVTRTQHDVYFIEEPGDISDKAQEIFLSEGQQGTEINLKDTSIDERIVWIKEVISKCSLSLTSLFKHCTKIYEEISNQVLIPKQDHEETVTQLTSLRSIVHNINKREAKKDNLLSDIKKLSSDINNLLEKVERLVQLQNQSNDSDNSLPKDTQYIPATKPKPKSPAKPKSPPKVQYKDTKTSKTDSVKVTNDKNNHDIESKQTLDLNFSKILKGDFDISNINEKQLEIIHPEASSCNSLTLILKMPKLYEKLTTYLAQGESFIKNFASKITPQALNHSNERGESAIYYLVKDMIDKYTLNNNSWQASALHTIMNITPDFIKKATTEALNKNGPDDYSSTLLWSFFSKYFKKSTYHKKFDTHIKEHNDQNVLQTIKWAQKILIEPKKFYQAGYKPIHIAAYQEKSDIMEILIEQGAKVNPPIAAAQTHTKALELLAPQSMIDNVAKEGWTALHVAAYEGHTAAVNLLLKYYPRNIDAITKEGKTPLFLAVEQGKKEVVRLLLDLGAKIEVTQEKEGTNPLHISVVKGNIEIIQLLLNKLKEDNNLHVVNSPKKDGPAALHLAAEKGNLQILDLLLQYGARIDICVSKIFLPIYFAFQGGKEVFARLLKEHLKYGDFINSAEGHSLITCAIINGATEPLELLLDNIHDINAPLKEGELPPLHLAAQTKYTNIVKLLTSKYQAKLDKTGENGWLPIHYTINAGRIENIEPLLPEAGINVATSAGGTPLIIVLKRNHPKKCIKTVKFLLEKGADASIHDHDKWFPIHCAAEAGNVEVMKLLFTEKDININVVTSTGATPLIIGIKNNHPKIAKFLLEKGADASIHDHDKWLPIHYAADTGNIEVIKLLFAEKGININAATSTGLTPLIMAIKNTRLEMVKFLLEKGADASIYDHDEYSPIHFAAEAGNIEIMKLLLEAEAIDINATTKDDSTALHIAAKNGDGNMISLLLKYNARTDIKNEQGCTPMHFAAYKGYAEVVEQLGTKNSDLIDSITTQNETPLFFAASKGHETTTNTLLELKASSKITDIDKWTPLHKAAYEGHTKVVEQLVIKEPSLINDVEKHRETALFLAAEQGHIKTVAVLLENNADSSLTNENEWTPLHAAARKGCTTVVEQLLQKKPHLINCLTKYQETALFLAAEKGHSTVINVLLNYKANSNIADEDGWTPLHVAACGGYKKSVNLLANKDPNSVNSVTEMEETVLSLAGKFNKKNVFDSLLNKNQVDVSLSTNVEWAPIHSAIKNNWLDSIELLLKKDPKVVNATTCYELTTVELAQQYENEKIIQLLQKYKDVTNFTTENGIIFAPIVETFGIEEDGDLTICVDNTDSNVINDLLTPQAEITDTVSTLGAVTVG